MHLDIKNLLKKKKKKRERVEKLIESRIGGLNKFVISNKQNIEDNLGKKLINEQEIHKKELEDNENTIDVSKSVGTNI
jgi:C4-type Zn-finger protein